MSVAILACGCYIPHTRLHGTSGCLAIHAVKLVEEGLTPGRCAQHSLVNHDQQSYLYNN